MPSYNGKIGQLSMAIAIKLEPNVEKKLEALSARAGKTKADYLHDAIVRAIEDIEDVYAADAAYESWRTGKERTFTLQEVKRDLGLDD